MGAWGEGPFGNDAAADFVVQVLEPCHKVIDSKTSSAAEKHYAMARVGIQIRLLAQGTDILGGASLEPALEALQRMRADEEWIAGWRSPKQIQAALDAEIAAVQRTMKAERRPKRRVTDKAAGRRGRSTK